MKILAIETSCDDTCIAIIEVFGKRNPRFKILSNIVSSQVEIHKKWGGVYPALAKREHQRNLSFVLIKALKQSKLLRISKSKYLISKEKLNSKILKLEKIFEQEQFLFKKLSQLLKNYEKPDIDLIAVTTGPGLEPCLWAGINFARALSYFWNLPIIPINHIESHILSNWLKIENRKSKIKFPAICLVVSGGHTQLIFMKKIGSYKILGETRDDAAGECFDKVARILGLGYPGGPAIEVFASRFKIKDSRFKIKLPRPMLNQNNFDFSFSGLKTAVLYNFKNQSQKIQKSEKYIKEMSKETQQSVIDVLLNKTKKAAKDFKAKTIILGGGVVANKELRKQFHKYFLKERLNAIFPEPFLSTDNAAMTGLTAYFHLSERKSWKEITANANLNIGDES